MSQRTKKYLLVSMVALLIGAGLIVGCVSQQAQINQKTNIEGVSTINTHPEVIWGDSQWYNPIGKAYDTSFKIPERYALRPYQTGNGQYIPQSLVLTTPDLKPLSEEKQDCRSTTQLTAECLSNIMEIEFGHDLNRQVFKDMGINEDNYLNYYFDEKRAEYSGNGIIESDYDKNYIYGLNGYFPKKIIKNDANNTYQIDDIFILKDEKNNVKTSIECTNQKIKKSYYLYHGYNMPSKCVHRFIINSFKMQLFVKYERQYLPQWQQIQNSVTNLINQFHKAATVKRSK